ncbi:hypothetical protein H681_12485 [Pseudomonas sp. ATCC 13867]|uniref:hypothetical protein n=1 Tax=Pseudomonas sp. ATCC 13867 TaxID=1294143 RepID=UPI0002C4E32B|nr:hypothetical protein [Pseudomonas sp. ATCC 13867]AGI24367.1 hypothetical protein H681_12485 [Pseudomonas sp. ATCC 13867]RFQ21940.1 hypothetical protein D0N87_23610 [Pseudomonas sp. ATCC 13867]
MRALLLCAGLLVAIPAGATEISWSVKNGFPVFKNADAFQDIKKLWPASAPASEFLAGRDAKWFRDHLPKTHETLWNPSSGLYDKQALFSRQHVIAVQATGAPQNSTCRWYLNNVLQGLPVSCDSTTDITISRDNQSIPLRVEVSGGESAKTDVFVKTYTILALGDSFASGEGNPDRAAVGSSRPTDDLVKGRNILREGGMSDKLFTQGADWWDTTCHRSLLSWQSMYALKLAVSDPHLVVRFASFSCSGAETYDGFFRAQMQPPVKNISSRVAKWPERDGGNYLELTPVHSGEKPQQARSNTVMLNKSQLNAAINLLCPETPYHDSQKDYGREVTTLIGRKYFGVVKFDGCPKKLMPVDEVLMSFGGNDTGFSGVVKWGLVPTGIYPTSLSTSKNPILATVGKGANMGKQYWMNKMRVVLGVIDPDDAAKASKTYLGRIYDDMNEALVDNLSIDPRKVRILLYPNPLKTPFQPYCEARLNMGNIAMTEKVVYYMGGLFPKNAKAFMFLINEQNALKIENDFIEKLRADQLAAIKSTKWQAVDSQPAFDGRAICSVSPECSGSGVCPYAERFAWTRGGEKKDDHPSMDPITSFARWEPYSSERTRGLRTANDAFMTLARFNSDGDLMDDWFRGSVHPDAKAHSAIADHMSLPKVEELPQK